MTVGKPPDDFRFTVEDLVDAEGGRVEAWEQRARSGLVDKESYLYVLHRDLDDAIQHLEADAPSYVESSEDAITRTIVSFMVGRRYVATSDTFERGHVDIHIRSERLKLRWNGEAKIHSDYDHALEGMRQLLTRYASGTHHHGGFFLYVRNRNADSVEKEWRARVVADVSADSCATKAIADDPVEWRFQTTHDHSTGRDYFVRHHIVHMHFDPKDKSGLKRQAGTTAVDTSAATAGASTAPASPGTPAVKAAA